ncbi:MAG: hypothetical protein WBG10_01465 [Pseudolabrys sp.]
MPEIEIEKPFALPDRALAGREIFDLFVRVNELSASIRVASALIVNCKGMRSLGCNKRNHCHSGKQYN